MDLGFRGRACTLALLALAGLAQPAEASHFRYGTLSWASTGNPNDPAEVRFRLKASFRRTEFGNVNIGDAVQENVGPTVLFFGDGGVTVPLIFRVTAVSLTEDWFLGEAIEDALSTEFGIVHSYANAPAPPGPAGPFIAFLGGIGSPIPLPDTNPAACCRIADPANPQVGEENLANRPGLAYPLQTRVFPLSGNSSPVSTMVPIVVVPPSTTATFTVPAADPDGDAITWRLSTDEEAGGPMHPPGISIDPTTGVVTWNNLTSGPGGTALEDEPTFWTTQFVIEDHDTTGAVKTKTPVDFLLLIRPQVATLPTCAISPGGPLSATVGNMLSFTVTGTDVDLNDTVTLNVGAIPSGATMTPVLPFSGPTGVMSTFAWTPAAADVGAHTVMFSATDTAGQQGLCQTTIQVIEDNPDAPTCAIDPPGPHTVQLGTSLSFTVTGTDPTAGDSITLDVGSGGLPLGAAMTPALPFTGPTGVQSTFNWTPSAGDLGPHLITFTATDSTALQRTCQTTVQVVPANPNAPTCSIDPSQTVTVGTPVGFTVMGTDPDPNDVLNLALTSGALPSGATLTPTLPTTGTSPLSSVFSWTPSLADAGVAHTFSFLVTDTAAQQADCQTTITVLGAVNNPPVCTIEFLSGTGGPGGGGDDDDDNGDHDDEDDDGDNGHDNDGDDKDRGGNGNGDREGRRNRNGQALSILADRESDHDGDDRDDDNGDSDDDNGDGDGGNGGGVPAGRLVAFRVTGTDPDLGDVLTLTDIVPAGTTMTPPLPLVGGSPVISEGQWTPNLGQVGPQVFSFTVTDLAGAQGFCMATVEVVQRPPRCEIIFPDGGGGKDDDDKDKDKDNDKDDDKDRDKDGDKHRDGDRDASQGRAHRNGGNGENGNGDGDGDNGDGDDGDEGGRSVRPGTRVTFRVRATDPDVGDIITLVSGPLPSGATMDPALPLSGSSPLVSRFLWTPTQTQLGTHVITFTVTDLAGEQGMCRARIKVTKRGGGCPNGDDDKDDDDKDKDGDRDDDKSRGDDRRAGTEDASRATNGVSHRDRDDGNGDNGDGDNGDGDNGDGEGCKPDDDGHDGGDKDDDKDRDQDKDHDKDKDHDQGDGDRDSANH